MVCWNNIFEVLAYWIILILSRVDTYVSGKGCVSWNKQTNKGHLLPATVSICFTTFPFFFFIFFVCCCSQLSLSAFSKSLCLLSSTKFLGLGVTYWNCGSASPFFTLLHAPINSLLLNPMLPSAPDFKHLGVEYY